MISLHIPGLVYVVLYFYRAVLKEEFLFRKAEEQLLFSFAEQHSKAVLKAQHFVLWVSYLHYAMNCSVLVSIQNLLYHTKLQATCFEPKVGGSLFRANFILNLVHILTTQHNSFSGPTILSKPSAYPSD